MNPFQAGQRVIVSPSHHWARGAKGTVAARESREVPSLTGIVTYVWVELDSPQIDADGDGPYFEAEISVQHLHAA